MNSKKQYFLIYLKGICMGAADVVPGVSGGTIALITGIYPRLIKALANFDLSAWNKLRQGNFAAAWRHVDGAFLLTLLAGILTAIFSLAKLVRHLLESQPIVLWSFFFGLILASVYFVGKKVGRFGASHIFMALFGAALAIVIGLLPVTNIDQPSLLYLFFCGALAICAMILPGISGAFILVLLGSYATVLQAVHQFELQTLAVIAAGAVLGLLLFSRVLNYLFTHFYALTLATLTGFIAGSLVKIWPWRTLGQPVLPTEFNGDPQIFSALCFMVFGLFLIIVLETFAAKKY